MLLWAERAFVPTGIEWFESDGEPFKVYREGLSHAVVKHEFEEVEERKH